MGRHRLVRVEAGLARWAAAGVRRGSDVVVVLSRAVPSAQQPVQPGDPLPGISPAEFEDFRLGLEDFLEVETAEEGLGPAYNATSCAGCHNVPAVGGIAPVTTVRAGIRDADGSFRDVDSTRGSLFQVTSIPTHGCQSVVPPEANVIARRVPIPLFGAGLVEAIPDTTILALADPNDADGDGVSGRAAMITDRASGDVRVGRFGWKAQIATLLEFSGDAYRNEMGITNDLFPEELTFNLTDMQLRFCDPIPEPEDVPELGTGPARHRQLRGVHEVSGSAAAWPEDARRSPLGRRLFDRSAAQCATCRVSRPALISARSSTSARWRSFPISCCTTSERAMGFGRSRESPKRSGHLRCGGSAFDGHSSTMAAPRRSPTRSASMPNEAQSAMDRLAPPTATRDRVLDVVSRVPLGLPAVGCHLQLCGGSHPDHDLPVVLATDHDLVGRAVAGFDPQCLTGLQVAVFEKT